MASAISLSFQMKIPRVGRFLHSSKVLATLRALEKELRPYIPRSLNTGVQVRSESP
jgi:hypothetical protein